MQFFAALIFYYLLIIIFFNRLTFQPNDFASAPDYISGVVLMEASEKLAQQGPPLWSPYFFGGMPCIASLQYPVFTYTFFNWGVVNKLLAVLFINPLMEPSLRLMLFHFLMAGIFTYLLARSLGFSWMVGVFSGLIFMFTPQLIVLPNVGHGSKLFSASYIPLVFLAAKRMLERRRLIDFALMVFAVGMVLLSIHVQMAFYALLAAGMYLVWSVIFDFKDKPVRIPLKVGLFIAAVLLGVCFAASAYFPVYEYSPYSIRGGTEGGLDWDYATKWSFNPLESLTYIVPSFFGFGGATYWGYMPFTDMPLYWGISALFFALLAAVLARNRVVWFFIILFLFAWLVSFGNFLPILYKPMFTFMPFFKRFRVPVMIQILMVFSVAVLAGFGLEKVRELGRKTASIRWIAYTAAGVAGFAILVSILHSPLGGAFSGWISANRPQIPAQYHGQLFKLAFGDMWKTALFALATLGILYAFLRKKLTFPWFAGAVAFLLIIDLWLINLKLINPVPHSNLLAMKRPTPAVNFLRQQEGLFRIYPLDRVRPQNWYASFGLQSINGYMGTKMKRYQEALDGIGLNNFNLINILNGRFFLSDRELPSHPMLELVMDGQQKVYLNRGALPRCWLVHNLVTLPEAEDRFQYIKTFNPWETAVVEEPIELPPGEGGLAEVIEYSPLKIKIGTRCDTESFLVLSEIYYLPYWTAALDDRETKIYPTNHLLRGVIVPAGEHTVVFTCESKPYKLGWLFHWITGAGLLVVFMIHFTPILISRLKKR